MSEFKPGVRRRAAETKRSINLPADIYEALEIYTDYMNQKEGDVRKVAVVHYMREAIVEYVKAKRDIIEGHREEFQQVFSDFYDEEGNYIIPEKRKVKKKGQQKFYRPGEQDSE